MIAKRSAIGHRYYIQAITRWYKIPTRKEINMGTNYYLHSQDPCEHCGRSYPELHIGKSSAGWVFALHVGDVFARHTTKSFSPLKHFALRPRGSLRA